MYNKLFAKILDSSVWLEDHTTVRVWFTLMAVMDEDGYCSFASPANLAVRARVTPKEAQAALDKFEAPDPFSSDPENDGRRIERVPGGWIVLNSMKYRKQVTREEIRRKTRERVQRFREKKRETQDALQGEVGNAENGFGNAGVTENALQSGKCNADVTQEEAEEVSEEEAREEKQVQAHARTEAKRVALSLRSVVALPDEDLSEMAEKIAVAHPRSRLKNLNPMEIPQKDLAAVCEAITREALKGATTAEDAGAMLLAVVEALGDAVPRNEWHFLKPVSAYFGEFEYRRDPMEFVRSKRAGEGSRNGKRRGAEGNDDVLRQAMSEAGHVGDAPESEVGGWALHASPGGGVRQNAEPEADGGVLRRAGGAESESTGSRLQPGDGGVQVFSSARYPPRVQWPRR